MKMNMYVVKNELNGLYEGISLLRTDAMAARTFSDMAAKSGMNQDDFKVYRIGEYDIENGLISDHYAPVCIPLNVKTPIESAMVEKEVSDMK